jgi:hypothetical protein
MIVFDICFIIKLSTVILDLFYATHDKNSDSVTPKCKNYIIKQSSRVNLNDRTRFVAIHARPESRHSTSHHYKATGSFPASKAIYISFGISITSPSAAEYMVSEASFSSRR